MRAPAHFVVILLLAAAVPDADAQVYPNAKTGGNYMHNYYFPPAASSTPWVNASAHWASPLTESTPRNPFWEIPTISIRL